MWGCACHRLRQPGHNVHCFYGDELENFDSCCRRLMKRIKAIIPDGCPRARIRATSRISRRLEDGGTLGDTLGDEARGMVVVGNLLCPHPGRASVCPIRIRLSFHHPIATPRAKDVRRSPDFDGHPQKYEDLKIMSDVVAKEVNIFKVDVPRENGRGWKRTAAEINARDRDLGEGWRDNMASGAKYVIQETWVKANDPHFDAKVCECQPRQNRHGRGSGWGVGAGSRGTIAW